MSDRQLIKKAVCHFQRKEYTEDSAVRHARKGWLKAVEYLRNESARGWVMDRSEEIKHAEDPYLLRRQAG